MALGDPTLTPTPNKLNLPRPIPPGVSVPTTLSDATPPGEDLNTFNPGKLDPDHAYDPDGLILPGGMSAKTPPMDAVPGQDLPTGPPPPPAPPTPKISTPIGPMSTPSPTAVASSGGLGGYLSGLVGKLPKAFAIAQAGYGNPAPLQAIEGEEARKQQADQQQFDNTITKQREDRATQLFGSQLENFRSELQYRQFRTQLEQKQALKAEQDRNAAEIGAGIRPYMNPDGSVKWDQVPPEVAQKLIQLEKTGTIADHYMVGAPGSNLIDTTQGTVQQLPGNPLATKSPMEQAQGQLSVALQNGDAEGAKKWTDVIKGIDVEGQQRMSDARQVHQDALDKQGSDRLDKSYTYNNNILEKVRKPIDDRIERLQRLDDSISQRSPQADALIAPELLTVMAGGTGSGMRINEAEITRVVGGQSKWEQLKSWARQYSIDPSKATRLGDEQRREVQSLMDVVRGRIEQKRSMLDSAGQDLINSTDINEHRSIVSRTQRQLVDIDTPTTPLVHRPNGPVVTKGGPAANQTPNAPNAPNTPGSAAPSGDIGTTNTKPRQISRSRFQQEYRGVPESELEKYALTNRLQIVP